MERIEYYKFPEELSHIKSIKTKDMTIINTGFAYPDDETEQIDLSQVLICENVDNKEANVYAKNY